jgi:hypothetical protein
MKIALFKGHKNILQTYRKPEKGNLEKRIVLGTGGSHL